MTSQPESSSSAEQPQSIGPYQILGSLGEGGMGQVFLAKDEDGRRLAVKRVQPWLQSRAGLARFRRERQVLAGLTHPGIARLVDGGSDEDGQPYLVLEYVEGVPIDRACQEQDLDLRDRVELCLGALEALAYAHAQLVVHGDLKPSNILADSQGRVRLIDFGVATSETPLHKAHAASDPDSKQRYLTPTFASPEQRGGVPPTPASDVYSFGAVLVFLLTGAPPKEPGGTDAVQSLCASPLDSTLQRILTSCLDPSPRKRPADAQALHELLEAWRAGRALPGASLWERLGSQVRHRPGPLLVTGVSLLAWTALASWVQGQHAAADRAWKRASLTRHQLEAEAQDLGRLVDQVQSRSRDMQAQQEQLDARVATLEAERSQLEGAQAQTASLAKSLTTFSVRLHRDLAETLNKEGLDLVHAELGLSLVRECLEQLEAVHWREDDAALGYELASAYHTLLRLDWTEESAGREAVERALDRCDAITEGLVATATSPEVLALRAYALYWRGFDARRRGHAEREIAFFEQAREVLDRAQPGAESVARVDVLLALAEAYRLHNLPEQGGEALAAAQAILDGLDPDQQPPHLLAKLAGLPLETARWAFLANQPDEALRAQETALDYLARAARESPDGGRAQLQYLTQRAVLATYLLERGRGAEGLELLLADEAAWQELSARSGSRRAFLEERNYRARLAQAFAFQKNWPAAYRQSERRLELAQDLQAHQPSAENARDVAVSLLRCGQFELSMGRFVEAMERLQSSRSQLQDLLGSDPDHMLARVAAADCAEALGDVYGVRASQLTQARDQLRVVGRAIDALEEGMAHFAELERRGQLQPVFERNKDRMAHKLQFARGLMPQFEAAIAAQEGSHGDGG